MRTDRYIQLEGVSNADEVRLRHSDSELIQAKPLHRRALISGPSMSRLISASEDERDYSTGHILIDAR